MQDRIACSDLDREKRTGLGLGECYMCMNRLILLELSWAFFSHGKGAGPLKESSDTIGGFCALCNTARKKEVLISLAKQPLKAPEQFLALIRIHSNDGPPLPSGKPSPHQGNELYVLFFPSFRGRM